MASEHMEAAEALLEHDLRKEGLLTKVKGDEKVAIQLNLD